MADLDYDDDACFQEQEFYLKAKVEEIRNKIEPPSTHCKFCDDPLPSGQTSFCDAGCRDLYEKEQHNKRVRGLA